MLHEKKKERPMEPHPIVSSEEWLAARKALLVKEKELTRVRDQLNAARRALPWVKIEKEYVFEGPDGRETLADLFAGRSQLNVKHFMFGPGWKEGCVGCSFETDHVDSTLAHLEHHDVTTVLVSRAPFAEIVPFKQRMGWQVKWVSSYGSDFNYDFHVSFRPEEIASGKCYYNYDTRPRQMDEQSGHSMFYKNADDEIFHTYSCYARGDEQLIGTYNVLDLMPKGRNENGPNYNLTDWVRHHDRYEARGPVGSSG
jgi:predicted dithiol-disulfide oxidoreductase (DUF899 family)